MIINRYLFIALAILGIAFSIGILYVNEVLVRYAVLIILLIVGIIMLILLYGKKEMQVVFNKIKLWKKK